MDRRTLKALLSYRARRTWRCALPVLALAIAALALPSVASALTHNPKGRFLGVAKSARSSARAQALAQAQAAAANLTYHNGAVMHTNRTHVIYWEPSGFSTTSTYKNLINGYLSNVAADSGKHSNVYASDVQYTDTTGRAAYASTFGGALTATDPFPASVCSDAGRSVCLTDDQISAEVNHVITSNDLPRGLGDLYVVVTPPGVGSCFDTNPADGCAYVAGGYCAYHSWTGSGSSEFLYSNQPYPDDAGCDSGQHPNGDTADSTINLISHEHNEAITDPDGLGWWDSSGNENGDKCAWNFGNSLGSTANGAYNQLITNTGHYYLQQEWSNASRGCVLTMPNSAPTAVFGFTPSSPSTGQSVSFDGSGSSDSDGSISGYTWTFGDGATGSGAHPAHAYSSAGTYTVTLTVTDNDGSTNSVSHQVQVTGGSNTPPVVSFTFSPSAPTTAQSVSFDGTGSHDPDGTIASYSWTFGDGATGSGATPTHTYAAPGTYTAALTVTDNGGATNSTSQSVTVASAPSGGSSPNPPSGSSPPASPGPAPLSVAPAGSALGALPTAGARLLIPSQSLRLSSSRIAAVLLRCGSGRRCAGQLKLTVTVSSVSRGVRRLRTVVLGSGRFSIAALHAATLRVHLSRLAATLLATRPRVRVRLNASVSGAATGRAAVARSAWLAPAPVRRR